jgi:cytochrome c-type protein NapC
MESPEQRSAASAAREDRNRRIGGWRFGTTALVLSSVVIGALAWVGFNAALAWTNTEQFCLSCHEMVEYPYAEYLDTSHDRNAAGMRATCSDCHVPLAFWPKLARKIAAANDVYQHLRGTVDTPEKYRARRLHLAQKVWTYMQSSDSRECRSCHTAEKMDLEAQDGRAARKHEAMGTSGKTCIDCHQGIAHFLPDGYEPEST